MATIVFYQKPGCATNASQRRVLESAGHEVLVRDLLNEPWTLERLRAFFADLPVKDWFNKAAPAIKSGALDPGKLTADAALALLVANHLLIRRPLMEIGDRRIVGFDPRQLQDGASPEQTDAALTVQSERLEGCQRVPIPRTDTEQADQAARPQARQRLPIPHRPRW
jgi:nitrogenase-associated protein